MTVAKIKAIAPLADVYEIRSDAHYIVKIPRCSLDQVRMAADNLTQSGLTNLVICSGDIEFYEVS